jgi:hypothetical protein
MNCSVCCTSPWPPPLAVRGARDGAVVQQPTIPEQHLAGPGHEGCAVILPHPLFSSELKTLPMPGRLETS